jgi:COP9 signalosome complex subunit 5
VALIKMVTHAVSGGKYEVMGIMQGKVIGDTFIIMDAFGLPVQGIETAVNAGDQAMQYMLDKVKINESLGRPEHICGWYHSHPGYACFFSGTDVMTQRNHQMLEDPYLGIVIDPFQTMSSGEVAIGCFRSYPANYTQGKATEVENIPLAKIEEFGLHANEYFKLDHSFFKSKTDQDLLERLWTRYWVHTISSQTLVKNREFMTNSLIDVASKLEKSKQKGIGRTYGPAGKEEYGKVVNEAVKLAIETSQAM